ncbi:hypothetical protein AVL62_04760 [Serinicoccus chungangensis]|uniref:Uncharacterized protein n=1 Tax=Serinicoccus chungangensis TaxID=767452 RepID=A0A0W8I8A7_9MICO|nr:hypothetical protein [Serinicoccus chungangensis]KUG55625.1 hypothetical protein AVL62_04760 [Serinicoccus chungangensis]
MQRAYTSLHSGTDHGQDLVTALLWARDHLRSDQHVTLWCSGQEALPKGWEARFVREGVEVVAEWPRRRGGTGPRAFAGPLVAVGFNTLDTVIEVEPFRHPMCFVGAYDPRNDERFDMHEDHPHVRWVEAFEPRNLAGPIISVPNPLIEDGVVASALESFTAMTYGGKTMYDSRDGGRVTSGLMMLHQNGHRFDPERLFSAALRAGWKGSQALCFRNVAREVARGVRKRPSERLGLGSLERWRSKASEQHPCGYLFHDS